jgi:1A family penicillin-binding protein
MSMNRSGSILPVVAVVLLLMVGAGALLWQRCGLRGCPDVDQLRGYMPDEASVIYDRDGEELSKLYLTRRVVVSIDSLPEHVLNAFVAIEDQRFWRHGGVDWRRVVGALLRNVRAGGVEEGSSTITMQLARNVFPEQLPASQRTLPRKFAEARVARGIEARYSKEEILELYLNQIYFGSGAWGIESAAQEYFGKPAAALDLPESALLAALPRAPSRYNPRASRERALEGRRLVLSLMAEQGMITAEEAEAAAEARLVLRRGDASTDRPAPYFVESVRRILEQELGSALYTQGYRIYTTLDRRLQTVTEEEVGRQARAIEAGAYGRYVHRTYASVHADTAADLSGGTPYLQAAAVVMDARSGDVLALVGGRDFDDSQYNRAAQAQRQPGSAFKPFVYAAALSSGYSPAHQVLDQPLRMDLGHGQVWEPRNYDGGYSGLITVREALVRSKNVATVRIANDVGVGRVVRTAEQMGLGRMPGNPSMVLGTAEVTPLDLTAAYTAFATLGQRAEPRFITRVVDRHGVTVWSQQPRVHRVMDPAVAFVTTNIMEDVVSRGTGTAVRAAGFGGPAAGKTGTTQDAADVWYVGYTPDIVGAVWFGFDERKTIFRGATGGSLAAPVWGRLMQRAGKRSQNGWSAPPGVEQRGVSADGFVVAAGCEGVPTSRNEYFVRGTAPVASCYPTGGQYAYYDSLWVDRAAMDFPTDTLAYRRGDDDGWWDRMRDRVMRRTDVPPPIATDTTRPQPARPDTVRPDTAGGRPPLLGRPVDVPTIPTRPDTTRPPPDTSSGR